ncbi:transglutaminase-like domain-containing protein [Aquimarina longa]|uniref:transglutaminase-like domain-containing protein n=1 Tax=Aquimarina longa TaxID=1080221 RepID=UPI0007852195|nr:transglutaminase-like domain-containing protein [Aquimarina longa]
MEDLGKIEDAGAIVRGGGIDRHWQSIEPEQEFLSMFRKKSKHDWLFDSNLALSHFNLRSIEFGNWMTQQDRANFLYASTLSLHHLAQVLKIKDADIGLGGRLSIALGARGSGAAAAHYESTPYAVINLTKTQGFGALAHEYAHAVDNIISYLTKSRQTFVSGGRIIRRGYNSDIAKNGNFFEQQFEDFFNLLYFTKDGEETQFSKDISSFNKGDYYERRNEVFARSFEVYTFNLLKDAKIKDTFLVESSYKSIIYPNQTLSALVKPIIDHMIKKGFIEIRKHKNTTLQGITTPTGYKGFRKTLKESANLDDTLLAMKRIALRDFKQVEGLAIELQGNTIAKTSQNIWEYLRENTRYKLDQKGIEELRTPTRSIIDGQKGVYDTYYGIDCDDYTILVSALLLNLGIDHEYRVAAYEEVGKFQHIYPVAFDTDGTPYIIDIVPEIPHFNYEEHPIIDLKTIPMELHELSGIDPEIENLEYPITDEEILNDYAEEMHEANELEGIEDDYEDAILDSNFLSGFAEVYNENEADIVLHGTSDTIALLERGILAEVNKARQTLANESRQPTVLSQLVDVSKELRLIDTVMKSWNNEDLRDSTLMAAMRSDSAYTNFFRAIKKALDELKNEQLSGIDDEELDEPLYLARTTENHPDFLQDVIEDQEDDELEGFEIDDFEEDEEEMPNLSGFFKKVFRKVKRGVKKAIKFVTRFNPFTLAMRGAIILVLKLNLFKFSEKLIYGYLTRNQARQQGLNIGEWGSRVRKLRRAERFFTKIGGRASKFRRAIVRGRARRKTRLPLSGLGAVATTSTAAASGFVIFVRKLLQSIKPIRLVKKIVHKIKNKNKPTVYRPPNSWNPPTPRGDTHPSTNQATYNNVDTDPIKQSFLQKVKNVFTKHKKKWIFAIVVMVIAIVGRKYYVKNQKKHKRSLAGIKAARTRARNRKQLATPRRTTTQKRRTPQLKGSTTTIRLPSKAVSRRTRKTSNATRLRAMHKKAKELQKTSPKTKYSTLLKRAAKQI